MNKTTHDGTITTTIISLVPLLPILAISKSRIVGTKSKNITFLYSFHLLIFLHFSFSIKGK